MVARGRFELTTFGLCDLTQLSLRVGLHPDDLESARSEREASAPQVEERLKAGQNRKRSSCWKIDVRLVYLLSVDGGAAVKLM